MSCRMIYYISSLLLSITHRVRCTRSVSLFFKVYSQRAGYMTCHCTHTVRNLYQERNLAYHCQIDPRASECTINPLPAALENQYKSAEKY